MRGDIHEPYRSYSCDDDDTGSRISGHQSNGDLGVVAGLGVCIIGYGTSL